MPKSTILSQEQNRKIPKETREPRYKCMKCMRNKEKKRFRPLSNELKVEIGWKLDWKGILWVKVWGIERSWRATEMFKWNKNWVNHRVYIESSISIDQVGIKRYRELKLDVSRSIKEVSKAKIFEVLRRYWANKKSRDLAQCIRLVSRGIKRNPEKFNRCDIYWEVSRLVSSCYREAQKHEFSREKNMKCMYTK